MQYYKKRHTATRLARNKRFCTKTIIFSPIKENYYFITFSLVTNVDTVLNLLKNNLKYGNFLNVISAFVFVNI